MLTKGLALAALALLDMAEAQRYLTCNWRNVRGSRMRPTLIGTQSASGAGDLSLDLAVDQIKRGGKTWDYQLDIVTTLDGTFTNTVSTFDTRGCEEAIDAGTSLTTTTMLNDNLVTSTGAARLAANDERNFKSTGNAVTSIDLWTNDIERSGSDIYAVIRETSSAQATVGTNIPQYLNVACCELRLTDKRNYDWLKKKYID